MVIHPGALKLAIDKVITGEIQLQELVISKFLGQDLDKYRGLFPHVAAAIQLGKSGKSSVRGDSIQYIHTNAHHSNPLCRVTALDLVKQEQELNYDKEKYREMLLEAAEVEAKSKRCRTILVKSYSFQAPHFYERYGYKKEHILNGFPEGYNYYTLVKKIG